VRQTFTCGPKPRLGPYVQKLCFLSLTPDPPCLPPNRSHIGPGSSPSPPWPSRQPPLSTQSGLPDGASWTAMHRQEIFENLASRGIFPSGFFPDSQLVYGEHTVRSSERGSELEQGIVTLTPDPRHLAPLFCLDLLAAPGLPRPRRHPAHLGTTGTIIRTCAHPQVGPRSNEQPINCQ